MQHDRQYLQGFAMQTCSGHAQVQNIELAELNNLPLRAGARQITLEGVYHSPVGAVHVLEDGQPGRQWYGSRKVLKSWIGFVTCPRSELKTATVKVEDVLDQVAG